MPWKPEVFVENQWSRNGLVFATREEAAQSASNLFMRWTLCESYRTAEVDEPVNARLVAGVLKMLPGPGNTEEAEQAERERRAAGKTVQP